MTDTQRFPAVRQPGGAPQEPQLPDLRPSRAERAAAKVLPAAGAVWTAGEILHLTGGHALDTGIGVTVAAAITYGLSGREKIPAWSMWAISGAGAWLTAAAEIGPLHWWPYAPLTWGGLAAAAWVRRWANRHPAVTSAREHRQARADWLAWRARRWGLGGSHLVKYETTRLGEAYEVDTKNTGKRASQLASPHLAERIAEDYDLPAADRVKVSVPRPARIRISIRHENPWAKPVLHPLLDPDAELDFTQPYSIRQPAVIGIDPETGRPLEVPIFDSLGAKNISVVALKGSGKALALDTPLPTPTGWTTMGEVQPGDLLLGRDGKPTRVTAATAVMHDHQCYEVHFSDGEVIVADADHLWLTEDRQAARSAYYARTKGYKQAYFPAVRTTAQIAATLKAECGPNGPTSNHAIANCASFELPEADLPVPPYTLGAWLGDGHSRVAMLSSADPEVVARGEADCVRATKVPSGKYEYKLTCAKPQRLGERPCPVCGEPFRPRGSTQATCSQKCGAQQRERGVRRSGGSVPCVRCGSSCSGSGTGLCRSCWFATNTLKGKLRHLGVLGNKHIPMTYLRASKPQRRALLAGLLDTDGYCTPSGTVEFPVTSKRLALDVRELISSLGYSTRLRTKRVPGYTEKSSTCYTVTFTPPDKVFHLPRKAERQTAAKGQIGLRRLITDVRPVPSVPVRCIQVDNEDRLYLAGRTCIPTHNTIVLNALSERVTAAPDAMLIRINLSLKGPAEAYRWGPACHLTAFGPKQVKRAIRVLRAVHGIMEWRSAQYATTGYLPSPEDPDIVVILDEVDSTMAVPAIRKMINDIATKGREYGITPVRAGQRGTSDYSSAKVRSQDDVFIIGRVGRSGEVHHAAGNVALSLPDMSSYGEGASGVWAVAELDGHASLGRAFLLESEDSARIARERAFTQPGLPAKCREALGDDYEDLLATEVFADWAREQDRQPQHAAAAAHARNGTASPARLASNPETDEQTLARLDAELEEDMDDNTRRQIDELRASTDAKLQRAREIIAETAAMPKPPEVSQEEVKAFAARRWEQAAEETEIPPDIRARMLELLAGDGMSGRKIADALGKDVKRSSVMWWLNRLRWEGVIRLEGKGRAARWQLTADGEPPQGW